jgi:hypothetical protein
LKGRKQAIVLVVALALATQLSCRSMRIASDFDPRFDFAGIRTYAWLPDPPDFQGDTLQLHSELIDRRTRRVVSRELQALGWERVAIEQADIHVTYYLAIEDRVRIRVVSNSWRYHRAGWVEHHRTESMRREYEKGTMILDLLEPKERSLVWRASALTRIRGGSDTSRRRQQINEAAAKLVAEIPGH